ncbi:MAG TPA: arginine deiminase-related protein [Flavitalea sp.]|nr:arginine deiminase-related protein [Flavitalea sp.]
MSATSHILMIRPVHFTFNEQTAINNSFQNTGFSQDSQKKALKEFDDFVELLRKNKVDVTVIPDTAEPHTPDSIFPNNWISFHELGNVVLYPMFAENRRLERKPLVLETIRQKFLVNNIIDLTQHEKNQTYLEGTGSLVLDRDKRIAYACLSPRTDSALVEEFCSVMDYQPVIFEAKDSGGRSIYHTNVLMCVADKYVVICLEAIPDQEQKNAVEAAIVSSGKKLLNISTRQMNQFAGNMLQIKNASGEPLLIMSSAAYQALDPTQVIQLEAFSQIIYSPLDTIEINGGGSARCMMAEVFLEPKFPEQHSN